MNEPKGDKQAVCRACLQAFTINDSEQTFFAGNGFELQKRCVPCRQQKRARW